MGKNMSKRNKCEQCKGLGYLSFHNPSRFWYSTYQKICAKCGGSGKAIKQGVNNEKSRY